MSREWFVLSALFYITFYNGINVSNRTKGFLIVVKYSELKVQRCYCIFVEFRFKVDLSFEYYIKSKSNQNLLNLICKTYSRFLHSAPCFFTWDSVLCSGLIYNSSCATWKLHFVKTKAKNLFMFSVKHDMIFVCSTFCSRFCWNGKYCMIWTKCNLRKCIWNVLILLMIRTWTWLNRVM